MEGYDCALLHKLPVINIPNVISCGFVSEARRVTLPVEQSRGGRLSFGRVVRWVT